MHCRRIDNLRRMEGECENLRIGSSKKEGFYTVLTKDFHSCGFWEKAVAFDLIDNPARQNVAWQDWGGFALMSWVGDGADCNQWLTEADSAGA